jgi:hypothetical protein
MSTPPLVLDTNIYSFARIDDLARLAGRGLVLRLSDIALHETWARSVREYQEKGTPLKKARGVLFKRASSVAPYLDKGTPIAASGGALARRIIAQTDGTSIDSKDQRYFRHLNDVWEKLLRGDMSDELWIENGQVAKKHLDELDQNLFDLARREEELRKNPAPDGVDAATLAAQYAKWDSLTGDEQLALLREYAKTTWNLSDATAERLDAHVHTTALRLHLAALGARMPKENDGADAALTMHIGDGCVLLTNETHLVEIVDQSGTFQRPWVRRLDDLDALPDCPPWGETAREANRAFRRRS